MNTTCQFEADIAEKDILLFSQLSGDTNPLHLDPSYAGTTEFGRPIAHGAYLIGFVSRVLGLYIPGRESLILSMNVRFPKPLFYPARIRVLGALRSFNEKRNIGVVSVQVQDTSKGWPVVESEFTFSCHEKIIS
jgi:3-hydroxybutyryl-CoA dehydratase